MEYSFLQFSQCRLVLILGTNSTRFSPECTLPHTLPQSVLPSSALLPTLLSDARGYSQLVETCWYSWQHQAHTRHTTTPPTPTVDQHVLFISGRSELCISTSFSILSPKCVQLCNPVFQICVFCSVQQLPEQPNGNASRRAPEE